MSDDTVIRELMQAAVSGVSKTQVFRHMKEKYKLNDEDVNELVKSCKFKQQPKKIDYNRFYDISATKIAKKIEFPFTQIYLSDNFLPKDNCKKLIELIASQVRPSTVSNSEDKKITSDYRTSKTADLHYFHSPFVNSLDWKICKFMGLDPFLGETLQAQSYLPGEYYKEHHDFFHPKTKECSVYTEWMGQRTWTFFCYLNDVEEGGETYFKHLKLKIKPKAGTVVIWNNLYKNGLPNYKTAHEALPPVSGNKYVITKWFRSWPLI
jgi:prolyl 4-hydroxylase